MMQRLEKLHDASMSLTYLMENPAYVSALTDGQAQQINTTLGIALGDQSTRARLALMLAPLKALPDNPEWQALKIGQPLAEAIRGLATKYTGNTSELLLGTLTTCTKPGKEGQNEAMAYWNKAKTYDGPGTRTIPAMRAAARNMYRAVLLDQGGDYRSNYRLEGTGDANQLLITDFRGEVHRYQNALVLLDQSPDFPPIGAKQKKVGLRWLAGAAKDGYEPAKAKLKEL